MGHIVWKAEIRRTRQRKAKLRRLRERFHAAKSDDEKNLIFDKIAKVAPWLTQEEIADSLKAVPAR